MLISKRSSLVTMIMFFDTVFLFPLVSVATIFRVEFKSKLFFPEMAPYVDKSIVIVNGAVVSSPTFSSSINASTLLIPLASVASIEISKASDTLSGSFADVSSPAIENSRVGAVVSTTSFGTSSLSFEHEVKTRIKRIRE